MTPDDKLAVTRPVAAVQPSPYSGDAPYRGSNYVPTVGADVLFVLPFGPTAGESRPAKVTRLVGGYGSHTVDLVVFGAPADGAKYCPIYVAQATQHDPHGQVPGSWH